MIPRLIHTPELNGYTFGDTHPMAPNRVRSALDLATYFGIKELFDETPPPPASPELLRSVHSAEYLEALDAGKPAPELGIGTEDNPLVPGLPGIAARIVSATVEAARVVWSGEASRAVNISGGLHHAQESALHGFCMFNDAAVAIRWLLAQGAQRVVYLDLDAHHGDGVEQIFWDDPRVLTISLHESGLYLFPGTGFPTDIGGPAARGTAVNVALPREVSDLEWLRAVHGVVPPLLQAFQPEIIISQHGSDPHRNDPLADMNLSADALGIAYRSVRSWAGRFAGGKWVALGGGGYDRDSIARVWTQLLAAVADVDIPPSTKMPCGWSERLGAPSSRTFGDDGAATGLQDFHPERVLTDSPCPSLIQTSRAIFPYWNLVPFH